VKARRILRLTGIALKTPANVKRATAINTKINQIRLAVDRDDLRIDDVSGHG